MVTTINQNRVKTISLQLERWLSSEEHWLLFPEVLSSVPSTTLTSSCNSSPRSNTSSGHLEHLHTSGLHNLL